MADFCMECSIRIWGEDTKDLADLVTKEEVEDGMVALVLCEGCGPISVDHEGRALTRASDNG